MPGVRSENAVLSKVRLCLRDSLTLIKHVFMKSSIDYENTVGSTNPRYARTYVSLSHTHVAF